MNVPTAEKVANQVEALTVVPVTWQQKKRARNAICALAGRGLDVTDDAQLRAAAEAALPVLEALDLIPSSLIRSGLIRRWESDPEADRIQLSAGRRHGTPSGYTFGCRCADCRAAINAAVAKRRRANAEKLRLGLVDVPHGHINTYANYLCRCPECTEANRSYLADWRDRRRKAGLE